MKRFQDVDDIVLDGWPFLFWPIFDFGGVWNIPDAILYNGSPYSTLCEIFFDFADSAISVSPCISFDIHLRT